MSGTPLLIMSIFGLLCCQPLSIVSWIMANSALKSGNLPAADVGPTNIARIIGMVGTVLFVLGIILWFTVIRAGVQSGAIKANGQVTTGTSTTSLVRPFLATE